MSAAGVGGSREQLFRGATGWGVDNEQMERDGRLRVLCDYPEVTGLEDRLLAIKSMVEEFKPNRIAVDSLSALEHGGSERGLREFVIGLTSFIKHVRAGPRPRRRVRRGSRVLIWQRDGNAALRNEAGAVHGISLANSRTRQ